MKGFKLFKARLNIRLQNNLTLCFLRKTLRDMHVDLCVWLYTHKFLRLASLVYFTKYNELVVLSAIKDMKSTRNLPPEIDKAVVATPVNIEIITSNDSVEKRAERADDITVQND